MSPNLTQQMHHALRLAGEAARVGEIPVGAVLFDASGTVLAQARNQSEALKDPTAHAEMLALKTALATGRRYFEDCTLAVTLEPCAMCMGALCAARVGTVIFGAYDAKSGGTVHGARVPDHSHFKPKILGGIEEEVCTALLKSFFETLRTD